jgi:SAM-dependent methyltransferase
MAHLLARDAVSSSAYAAYTQSECQPVAGHLKRYGTLCAANTLVKRTKEAQLLDHMDWLRLRTVSEKRLYVLDLACGRGGFVEPILRAASKYNFSDVVIIGVDFSETSIRDAAEERFPRRPGVHFVHVKDAFSRASVTEGLQKLESSGALGKEWKENGSVFTGKFHLVLCHMALHYAFSSRERALEAIRTASEALRPGGLFLGTVSNGDRLEVWQNSMKERRQRSGEGQQHFTGTDEYTISVRMGTAPSRGQDISWAKYTFRDWDRSGSPFGRLVDVHIREAYERPMDEKHASDLMSATEDTMMWNLKATEGVVTRGALTELALQCGLGVFRETRSGLAATDVFDIEAYAWHLRTYAQVNNKWHPGEWEFFSSYAVFSFYKNV